MLKSTLLLATMFFLLAAPEPDSRDIAGMTAGFIVPDRQGMLLAADEPAMPRAAEDAE